MNAKARIICAIWELQAQMYTEREIVDILAMDLCEACPVKAAPTIWKMRKGPERERLLRNALHGFVHFYAVAAGHMGLEVRDQVLIECSRPRLTTSQKKRFKFRANRYAIRQLWAAIQADKMYGHSGANYMGPEFLKVRNSLCN